MCIDEYSEKGGEIMNKIFLSGNLTRDFEGGNSANTNYARSAIAVNRQFSKGDEVDFFNLVAFNKTADFCQKYLSKGRRVLVEGRLQTNNFTDKNGNKRISYDVIVDNIEFGDNKRKDDNDNYNSYDADDVDVPF